MEPKAYILDDGFRTPEGKAFHGRILNMKAGDPVGDQEMIRYLQDMGVPMHEKGPAPVREPEPAVVVPESFESPPATEEVPASVPSKQPGKKKETKS